MKVCVYCLKPTHEGYGITEYHTGRLLHLCANCGYPEHPNGDEIRKRLRERDPLIYEVACQRLEHS